MYHISRPLAALYIQRKHTQNLKQTLTENYFSCCEILHFFKKNSLPAQSPSDHQLWK